MIRIKPNEIRLQGGIKATKLPMELDETSKRIFLLVQDYLILIGSYYSDWNLLYQDPEDFRYWELSYPESEMHGGGALLLKNIPIEEVLERYGFIPDGI